jgi:hypothetical protein
MAAMVRRGRTAKVLRTARRTSHAVGTGRRRERAMRRRRTVVPGAGRMPGMGAREREREREKEGLQQRNRELGAIRGEVVGAWASS